MIPAKLTPHSQTAEAFASRQRHPTDELQSFPPTRTSVRLCFSFFFSSATVHPISPPSTSNPSPLNHPPQTAILLCKELTRVVNVSSHSFVWSRFHIFFPRCHRRHQHQQPPPALLGSDDWSCQSRQPAPSCSGRRPCSLPAAAATAVTTTTTTVAKHLFRCSHINLRANNG